MAGNVPPRHGVDWGRNKPTRVSESSVGTPYGQLLPIATPGATVTPTAHAPAGRVPVSVIDAFYQTLPEASIQPIVKTMEGQFTFTNVDPNGNVQSLQLSPIELSFFQVPQQYVYLITDILYYAIAPSAGLNTPPIHLTRSQLAGFCRFELTFGGKIPLRQDCSVFSPYANYGDPPIDRTGWPFVDTEFGSLRTTGFALYARSQQDVRVKAIFDVTPRFTISRVGAHLHGYAVPEASFDMMFANRKVSGSL